VFATITASSNYTERKQCCQLLANFPAYSADKFSSAEKIRHLRIFNFFTVRHHHCQPKLHREKTIQVLPTLGKFSGLFGGNSAQLINLAPSLPAQTERGEKQSITMLPTLGQIFRPIRRIN
jgi:hypothetical protein